jgi:hypothetical protein
VFRVFGLKPNPVAAMTDFGIADSVFIERLMLMYKKIYEAKKLTVFFQQWA